MNIWLKELSIDDDKEYYELLNELSSYDNVYAKPLKNPILYEEFMTYE